jgi:hypothetical protein
MMLVGWMGECLRHWHRLYIAAGGGKHVPSLETAAGRRERAPAWREHAGRGQVRLEEARLRLGWLKKINATGQDVSTR